MRYLLFPLLLLLVGCEPVSASPPVATAVATVAASQDPAPPEPTPPVIDGFDPSSIKIVAPETADVGSVFTVTLPTESNTEHLRVKVITTAPVGSAPPSQLAGVNGNAVYLYAPASQGLYTFRVEYQYSVDRDKGFDPFGILNHTVTVGKPTPPKPPGPGPKPDPEPTPDSAPFPADGLHVLIRFESAKATSLTSGQHSILYSRRVRDFLGTNSQYRIYDADVDVSAESQVWQDAMKVKADSLPWLTISNGKTGYNGPLPADATAFEELVKTYMGN